MLSRNINKEAAVLAPVLICDEISEQLEDGHVWGVKFSEDGSLLAVQRWENLEMWKTSTWERLWSVPCEESGIDFSPDGLRVLVRDYDNCIHAYDVRSGNALGESDSMPNSIHDHVHWFHGEVGGIWECRHCKSLLLKNGEYWFSESDRWLWIVRDRAARRLIHFPAEYVILHLGSCSSYIAVGCSDRLVVLDTVGNKETV